MTLSVLDRIKSEQIFRRSEKVIPGGVNSPARAFRDMDVCPLVVEKGMQDQIIDCDGNSYIDFCTSWGALILGHAHPSVIGAACKMAERGSSFGVHTEIETLLAEKVVDLVPCVEKVRFVNSGTEATATVIRLARGFTKREIIVKYSGNYHGHVDALLVKAGSGVMDINEEATSKGIPKSVTAHTICLEYNDIQSSLKLFQNEEISKNIAGVILEPIAGNMGVVPASPSFLRMLEEETRRIGALLIMDEVITGFRVALQGACAKLGINPDLICLGKVLGGGYPVAALGGSAEIMNHLAPLGEVYQAGTLSGNPVAMAAGYQTLIEIERGNFYQDLEEKAEFFAKPIQKKLETTPHSLTRVGSMLTLFFGVKNPKTRADLDRLDLEMFRSFFLYLLERGIYIPQSSFETWFISSAHTKEHLAYAQDVILSFLK